MKKDPSAKELNAVIVGSKQSQAAHVGNLIMGREVFDPGDATSRRTRAEGDVCGRRVTLVKAPGWLRGYMLCDTPGLFRTEATLSVSLCPPGPHCFILVINAENPFKELHKKATEEHLQHFFGEKVLDHTIVVFRHQGQRTIEDYIRMGGEPLQSLLEACGKRYHVICGDGNDARVKRLFEKIDVMVAENGQYEPKSMLVHSVEAAWKEVQEKAAKLHQQSEEQRRKLRGLVTEDAQNLRILKLGWLFSGKSAIGDNILNSEVFRSGDRTVKALKQRGEVAGRQVLIVDTPGWWKYFPVRFTHPSVKSEILGGVSLCSPSPNVILLALPVDASFTEDHRGVIEANMKLLGQRVWRHVIVAFTCGDALGDKSIEQHIESEGKPLRWLIEKCGNRYHVLDNTIRAGGQVTELLEKMEEMIAGNSSFYYSDCPETDDTQPEDEKSDEPTEYNRDEKTTKEITEQLIIEWDHRNWAMNPMFQGNDSRDEPLNFHRDRPTSEDPKGEEEQMEPSHENKHFKTDHEDVSDNDPQNTAGRYLKLLEREWSRRMFAMEQMFQRKVSDLSLGAIDWERISEPDNDELLKSRQKVTLWEGNTMNPCEDVQCLDTGLPLKPAPQKRKMMALRLCNVNLT